MKKAVEMTDKPQSMSEALGRGVVLSHDCPSRNVLHHVTSRWGVLVLVVLSGGTYRFSALRRKIGGISERMLAQTLKDLEGDGFVKRVSFPVVPPHVEYSLTPLGAEISEKVESMVNWIEGNYSRIHEARQQMAETP